MGPDLDLKENLKGKLESLVTKEKGNVSMESEDRDMQCISNYQDRNFLLEAFYNEQEKLKQQSEELEVNIIECKKSGDIGQTEAKCEDATESMSSFGNTVSEAENGSVASDIEVESRMCYGNEPTYMYDGYSGAFETRKKKLTDHWRQFIRPLMWRCKWLELQIKEFQTQALKYDRELTEIEQRKQFDYEKFLVDGLDAKSLPFSSSIQRMKVMARKKRKRFEETTDIASYMSQHNLFSYYENKKSAVRGAFMGDDSGNLARNMTMNGNDDFGFQDGWATLESRDDDNVHEYVLRKVEVLKSQVCKLRARIEKVVSENPGKFCSVNSLSFPTSCDALTSSDQNLDSPSENEEKMPVNSVYTQHTSEVNTGDHLPESAVSNCEDVTPLLDMIESTSQPQNGVSCNNNEVGILLQNQARKEELQSCETLGCQLTVNPHEPMQKTTVEALETSLPAEDFVARVRFGGKTLPKSSCNASFGKRKRRKRRSFSAARNRRSTG